MSLLIEYLDNLVANPELIFLEDFVQKMRTGDIYQYKVDFMGVPTMQFIVYYHTLKGSELFTQLVVLIIVIHWRSLMRGTPV